MKSGKINDDVLRHIVFDKISARRDEVLVGSGTGIDSSIIDLGGDLLAITTDPVTAAGANIGKVCVNICLNDLAASGAEPVAIMVTLLAPPGTAPKALTALVEEIDTECVKLNIQLAGGHTEITDAVTRIVLSATAVGRKSRLSPARVTAGDWIIMTKGAAYEGSAIIAHDFEEKALSVLTDKQTDFLKGLIDALSVVPEAKIALANGALLRHDITEGGVLGAAWEFGQTAQKGVEIHCDDILIHPETTTLCQALKLDPLRLISSGALLIAAKESDGRQIIDALEKADIPARKIGIFTDDKNCYLSGAKKYPLNQPGPDELYKLFV